MYVAYVSLLLCTSLLIFSIWCLCFFKQKTAYEMLISDWSYDECSSDLGGVRAVARRGGAGAPCGRGVSPRARVHRDSRLSADARQHREDIAGAPPAGRCDREKPRDETHPGDDGRACKRFGGECAGRAAQPGEQHAIGHERGGAAIAGAKRKGIGRESCRERGCQYV